MILFLTHQFDYIEPSLQDVAFEKLLRQVIYRERQERSQRVELNISDNTTPWLQFTQWDDTFRGKDLSVR